MEEKRAWSEQELITMALDEEQKAAVTNRSIYSNVIRNRIVAFMKMPQSGWLEVVATWKGHRLGSSAAKEPRPREKAYSGLTPAEERTILPRLIANVEELPKLGYVMVPPDGSRSRRGASWRRGCPGVGSLRSMQDSFSGVSRSTRGWTAHERRGVHASLGKTLPAA